VHWWTAGLALLGAAGVAAWDVGRPGRATAPALLTMRAVGGLGLMALAALALKADAALAALVAATGAGGLLIGLLGRLRQPAEERQAPAARARARVRLIVPARGAAGEGRRAA
jgi:hypothetical protein